MSHRKDMLAALRGEGTDEIPWAPRLDLWYNARQRAGTLPHPYEHARLDQIVDDLGWGVHAVIPRFRDLRGPEDDLHRALGIYNLRAMPYATRLHNVRVTWCVQGDTVAVTCETPRGTVATRTLYDESMRAAGITITHIVEHAVKEPRDLAAVSYLFENAEVVPNREGFDEYLASVGDRGLAVGYLAMAASPLHLLHRELMPLEAFFYALHDVPDEMGQCAKAIGKYYRQIIDIAGDGPGEVFLFGANYDAGVTPPPFFRAHILPWLQDCARALHRRGKYLLTHADGENTGLLELYRESGIDIADSVCPAPMTRLSLRDVRRAFQGTISIMGGFPSVALLPHTVSDAAFPGFVERFFAELDAGDHLILGVSDSTPPQAELGRLKAVREAVAQFGPVAASRPPSSRAAAPSGGAPA